MAAPSLASLQERVAAQAEELERIREDHGLLRASVEALRSESQALRGCLSRHGMLPERPTGEGGTAAAAAAPPVAARPQQHEESTASSDGASRAAAQKAATGRTGGEAAAASRLPQQPEDSDPEVQSSVLQEPRSPRSECGSASRSRASSEPSGRRDGLGRWDLYKAALPLLQAGSSTRVRTRALKTVEYQLGRGASPHCWQGPGTPLQGAVQGRCADLVAALLRSRGSPDQGDEKGVSLLHLAAYHGQSEVCRVLLEARASANTADCHGQTPMFFAPSRQVCDLLYRSYADMNCTNPKGQSALHLAARAGLGDVLVWLSGRVSRAVLGLRDADGATAADYARNAGVRVEVLEKLEVASTGAYGGLRSASPRRLAAPPPPPGVDLSWESPATAAPGTGVPETLGLPPGGGSPDYLMSPSRDNSAPPSARAPGAAAREPADDFCFRSVAGGGPGHLDRRRSVRGELQERQARNAAKQDVAIARRMTAREL